MSLNTRSIYNADPSTFDATQAGVSIGDLVVDPNGTNPPGLIKGPNSGRTVAPLGSAAGPNNLVVGVVPGGGGSGLTTVNLVVQNSTGAFIPGVLVLLAWTTTVAAAPTVSTGTIIATVLGAGTLSGVIYVKADVFGIIQYVFNAAAAAALTINISSITTNPGQQLRNFISP